MELPSLALPALTSASTAIQSRTSRELRGRACARCARSLNGFYAVGLVVLGAFGDLVVALPQSTRAA